MFCPNCGNNVHDNGVFCGKCGGKIQPSSENCNFAQQSYRQDCVQQPYNQPVQVQQAYNQPAYGSPYSGTVTAKKSKTGLIIAVCIIAVIAICAIFMLNNNSKSSVSQATPENTINAYFEAYNRKDVDTMISLTTTSYECSKKEVESLVSLSKTALNNSNTFTKLYVTVDSVEESGNTAVAYCSAKTATGDKSTTTVNCVKHNGKWYLELDFEDLY